MGFYAAKIIDMSTRYAQCANAEWHIVMVFRYMCQ